MSRALFTTLWLALALASPSPGQRGPSFEDLESRPGVPSTGEAPARTTTWKVNSFDPARDVPAMENWIPQANVDGAAHCFAMSMLATQFHRRIEFVDAPGDALDDTWDSDDIGRRVLKPDAAGLQMIFEYLGGQGTRKLKVGGAADLRAFTQKDTESENLFRRNAEAMQFSLQIPTMGLPYAKTILFSSVDLCEKGTFTPEGLNRNAFEKVRAKVAAGEIAPFTIHPSKIRTDGHVIVAYEVQRTGNVDQFYCYDSNYPPVGRNARPTVVHFDRGKGTYEIRNHFGRKSYTNYDVLTVIRPDNRLIRELSQRIARHLDRYLWITDRFYATLEMFQGEQQEGRWKQWRSEFVDGWQGSKNQFKDRTNYWLRRAVRNRELN